MRITKKIFQIYSDPSSLPPEIHKNIEDIKYMNKGWDYEIYDHKQMRKFVIENYGHEIVKYIDRINPSYKSAIADFFRYLLIFKIGGIYLDIKSSMDLPLDNFLYENDQFITSQWRNRLGEEYQGWGFHPELNMVPGGELHQWYLASEPDHQLLSHVIRRVMFNIDNYSYKFHGVGKLGVLRTTGPICYTLAIIEQIHKFPFRILDSNKLGFKYSIYGDNVNHIKIFPNHYSLCTEPLII